MTDNTPPYGVPLTAKTVMLVKPGDLARSLETIDGYRTKRSVHIVGPDQTNRSIWLQYNSHDHGAATGFVSSFSFIARADPETPGWYLAPEGGFPENPVPGKWVEAVFAHGGGGVMLSDNINWDEKLRYAVDRFRIVDDPANKKDERAVTDFKEGDKVRVVFEGVWHEGGSMSGVNVEECCRLYQDGTLEVAKSIELIERAGRPLEVGEGVVHMGDNGIVVGVFEGLAWVMIDGAARPTTIGISYLSRPCGTPITEAKS